MFKWTKRQFGWEGELWCAYFWLVGWDCLQLGVHVCLGAPNIELHGPFGFLRIGRKAQPKSGFLTYEDVVRIVFPRDRAPQALELLQGQPTEGKSTCPTS